MDDLILKNRYLTEEVERQTQEVQRHIDRMAAMNQVASIVSQSLDLDRTLNNALRVVTNVIDAEAGGISLIDEATDEVVLHEQLGWENNFVNPPMRVPAGKGMSGQVIQNDEVLVVHDLEQIDNIAVQRFKEETFQSIVMAPMHARGKIIGILSVMSKTDEHFDDATVDLLRAIADTVGIALDNARLYQQSVENESRLSAVLQSTADGIITTDHSGTIRMINPSAERMLDIRTPEVCNRPLREAPIPAALSDPLRLALSSRDESPEKSFQVNMPDDRVLLVFVSPVWEGEKVLDDDKETQDGWVIVLQDVTHLREAEKMRAQFIQAAAHDMRNPLGVAMTSLGTLQSLVTDDIAQEVVGVALSGVNRMQRLLDDLLHLERIENGYTFNTEDVDITELIYECLAQARPLLAEKSQTHDVDIAHDLGIIQADAHWIGRSLTNYLSNANKYTPKGGHITLKAFEKQDVIHIEVTDNGLGIPLDVQSHLFERFYRVKDANTERGSGLGLAIVKSAMEAHNGGVYMRSKVGEGSTFGLTLPRHPEKSED